MRTAEDFYVSLGFPRLPESFLAKIRPLPGRPPIAPQEEQPRLGLAYRRRDRRALAHERRAQPAVVRHRPPRAGPHLLLPFLRRPEVPFLLRAGANRAFHEAVGELARLASEQMPYLRKLGLVRQGQEPDASAGSCSRRLDSIVFLPFAAGTMTHFEHDLYEATCRSPMASALVAVRGHAIRACRRRQARGEDSATLAPRPTSTTIPPNTTTMPSRP